jgi:hypothetical protein
MGCTFSPLTIPEVLLIEPRLTHDMERRHRPPTGSLIRYLDQLTLPYQECFFVGRYMVR